MANTYKVIASTTVGSGGAANITFSSIPSTYTDLCLVVSLRRSSSGFTDLGLRINGETSGYNFVSARGNGAATTGTQFTNMSYFYLEDCVQGSDTTANSFASAQIYMPNYTSSSLKSFSAEAVTETNATTAYMRIVSGFHTTSSAISSILMVPGTGGNWVQYSTATLYGIKKD